MEEAWRMGSLELFLLKLLVLDGSLIAVLALDEKFLLLTLCTDTGENDW